VKKRERQIKSIEVVKKRKKGRNSIGEGTLRDSFHFSSRLRLSGGLITDCDLKQGCTVEKAGEEIKPKGRKKKGKSP